MPAVDGTLDYKSLSLPDWRTALKKRIKRPKRPSFWEIYWLGFSIWAAVDGITSFMSGHIKDAVIQTILAGICWKLYQIVKKHNGNLQSNEYVIWIFTMLAFVFATSIWSIF